MWKKQLKYKNRQKAYLNLNGKWIFKKTTTNLGLLESSFLNKEKKEICVLVRFVKTKILNKSVYSSFKDREIIC